MPISDFYSSYFHSKSRPAAGSDDRSNGRGKAAKPAKRCADAPERTGAGSEYLP